MNIYNLSLKPETPCSSYWDYGMVNDLIGVGEDVRSLPKCERAIVKIPARHHADMVQSINKELTNIGHVVVFLMGDEEALFPIEELTHPSICIWVQNAHPGRHDQYNRIGTGFTPNCKGLDYKEKDISTYFSGQITHNRRVEMWKWLNTIQDTQMLLRRSEGFTEGVDQKQYYDELSRAKYAPCPSGAVIPDSFRLFEALQCMALPIADEVNPSHTIEAYWDWLLGSNPIYKIKKWAEYETKMNELNNDYPYNLFEITCWWIKYKRDLKLKVKEQYGLHTS